MVARHRQGPFSVFRKEDLSTHEVAGRYRDLVLAWRSADVVDLRASTSLGRSYTVDAYTAWLAQCPLTPDLLSRRHPLSWAELPEDAVGDPAYRQLFAR